MIWGLYLSALLLGLAGVGHCLAMCSVPCAAASRACAGPTGARIGTQLQIQAGRLSGYMVLGALAASSVGFSRALFDHLDALRPLWITAQVALVIFGLYVLVAGRFPGRLAVEGYASSAIAAIQRRLGVTGTASRIRPWLTGALWALLPCPQLYAGVVLSGLANHPGAGALAMLAFGLPSACAFLAGPRLLVRLRRWKASPRVASTVSTAAAGGAASVAVTMFPSGALPQGGVALQAPADGFSPGATRLAGLALAAAGGWMLLAPRMAGAWWC